MSLSTLRVTRTALFAASFVALGVFASSAPGADSPIFAPGEPMVTGFAGVVAPAATPPAADPLDYTFIDPDGQSAGILALELDGAPAGQLIPSSAIFSATARDVGQVFGVALDNAPELTGAEAPNIYLAATSAFGLNIVVPDADGNPIRSKLGAADASFMAGQWGSAGGAEGYPGSIWKIDGTTGEVSLFTTIAANTGAGLGGLAFDPSTQQFFVSDLDTGLIYRLAADGTIIDTYDHGVTGRPAHELDPVEDDGSAVDITDPSFNTEDPATWGFTQPERKVFGLAVHGGRLYYAVADGPQVWSVRINDDGSFGAARWELDVTGLASTNEIASIAFDPQGHLMLAQRGAQLGSYDYSVFAEPQTSSVVHYRHEFPDDPATPSTWAEVPQSFAIGLAPEGMNASGGIALGPKYNSETGAYDGACNATLWSTGDALRANAEIDPPLDGPEYVAGLQGASRALFRPLNDPPVLSAFADYDGNTDDDQASQAGHVGAVAIWQSCGDAEAAIDTDEPPFVPPPDYVPSPDFNLSLEKWSSPYACFDGGATWWCNFTIRVENTGDAPYWGPVSVDDYLPANNPGASMHFWPAPPWSCGPTGPTAYQCTTGPVLLYPGDGVTLHEVVKLPKAMVDYCNLANVAGIDWPFGFHDDTPGDDFDVGVAGIAGPTCVPPGGATDLALKKITFPTNCFDAGIEWACSYAVMVQNAGPGNFSGPIKVKDTLAVNAPATTIGPWACAQAGPVLTCDIIAPPVNAPPGWTSAFLVTAHVKKNVGPPLCNLDNKANIASPVGGPLNGFAGNDFDTAVAHIPDPACLLPNPQSDLEAKKVGLGCGPFFGGYICQWKLTITNVGPDPYAGPLSFKDVSTGAVANTLPSVAPFCAGSPTSVDCSIVGPVLFNPGVPHSLTFYTAYAGGPTVCSANNTLTIVNPSPGSAPNPAGNDSATPAQAIPNPACAGLPVLNITKTAKGCASDPSSPDWLCKFDIKVKNIGAALQPAPIKVKDFNSKPTTFSGAACAPSGVGQWLCTKPTPLAAGATWAFTATTRVDPTGVTLADCNVVNSVWITAPLSADPGHFSQASQKVPQLFINVGPGPVVVYCDPPSLKLSKTAEKTVKSGDGYDSTFTIKAISTGPDPYHGTVELDEVLPDGTSYVSSSWTCVPTTGNDVHCSSPYKNIPVGKFTAMTITIHIPTATAVAAKCNVVNVVNAAISAEVLHSDIGAQYTASAKATLPASACREPIQCPVNQVKPGGGCCDTGLVWDGKQCSPPPKICPRDSHAVDGQCECLEGTHGKPGKCKADPVVPACFRDSVIVDGQCVCREGTHGTPGKCKPDPVVPACFRDSQVVDGECVCREGTHGTPGKCKPDQVVPVCFRDSQIVDGECVCREGTHGVPGRCQPDVVTPTCPDDSHFDKRSNSCICNRPMTGEPGNCQIEIITPTCPDDSHFNKRANACVCNAPLTGEPGQCQAEIILRPATCPDDSHFDKRANGCVCNPPLEGKPGSCEGGLVLQLPTIN